MQTNFLFFLLCFLFWESFKLWRSFLMMLFIIRPRHQLVFGVSRDWTSDLLFNHLRFYQLSKQIKSTPKKKNFIFFLILCELDLSSSLPNFIYVIPNIFEVILTSNHSQNQLIKKIAVLSLTSARKEPCSTQKLYGTFSKEITH